MVRKIKNVIPKIKKIKVPQMTMEETANIVGNFYEKVIKNDTALKWKEIEDKKNKSPIYLEIVSIYEVEESEEYYELIDDLECNGMELMVQNNYEEAEKNYSKLLAYENIHHSAFEMLAYSDYILNGKNEKNLWLLTHAIEIAKQFYAENSLDIEVLDEMEDNLENIKNDKEINKWWIKSGR